jgi:hypothetical protein
MEGQNGWFAVRCAAVVHSFKANQARIREHFDFFEAKDRAWLQR